MICRDILNKWWSANPVARRIGQIHASLQELSQTLFDCKSEWPATVKGCQLYTEELTLKLSGSWNCRIV